MTYTTSYTSYTHDSRFFNVCNDCGSLVLNTAIHDKFHTDLARTANNASMNALIG